MRAIVQGGSGYTGGELLRLLAGHPHLEVAQVSSERLRGKPVAAVHPQLRDRNELRFCGLDDLEPADVVFSALRHGQTAPRIDRTLALAPVVVDLSATSGSTTPPTTPAGMGGSTPARSCSPASCTGWRSCTASRS